MNQRVLNAAHLTFQKSQDCQRLCNVVATVPADNPPDTVWIQQVNNDQAN